MTDSDAGELPSHNAPSVCLVISQIATSFMEMGKMMRSHKSTSHHGLEELKVWLL